jgi:predicted acetyltransferase
MQLGEGAGDCAPRHFDKRGLRCDDRRMASDFIVRRAAPVDRLPLFRMLELYQHDLSDIWDQDLDAHGEFGYALDRYWRDPVCVPFVFLAGGAYAGFALVDDDVKIDGGDRWMDQFFVMKKHRRRGVGSAAARTVFDACPGRWQVGQMTANAAAQAFWRRTIADFTGGAFTEHRLTEGWWQGTVQVFASPPPARP